MKKRTRQKVECTRLAVDGGICVELLNYGAAIKSLRVPVNGAIVDAVLGYPNAEDYAEDGYYMGRTLGRFAGRIDSARFDLRGRTYHLDRNDARHGHCLHGGERGFGNRFWHLQEPGGSGSAVYRYVSAAGEQGFPGELEAQVSYTLSGPMSLRIDYLATARSETIVNLSNHSYFNLNGGSEPVTNHEIRIDSDRFLPLATNMIPTGEILGVDGSDFDFRHKASLGQRLMSADPQLQVAGGFDHFFLLNRAARRAASAAEVFSPQTGLTLTMYSTQPGLQFYSGNSLDGPFERWSGLCFEFQSAPNSPNMKAFPGVTLKPGETYRRRIVLEFAVT